MAVDKLPQPRETILARHHVMQPGGKGMNQAVAAARDGSPVIMVGAVGDDPFGHELTKVLTSEGVDNRLLRTVELPTGCACVTVDNDGENTIAVAPAANLESQASQIPDSLLGPETTLLLQMEVAPSENFKLISRAKSKNSKIILNLSPYLDLPTEIFSQISVLILNEIELENLTNVLNIRGETVDALLRSVARHCDVAVVVTLGSRGALAIDPKISATPWKVGCLPIIPADSTGAGDCFAGVIAGCLDREMDLQNALHRASVAAGLNCLALGAQTGLPRSAAIDARIADLPPPQLL